MSDNIVKFRGKHVGLRQRSGAGSARKPYRRSDKSFHTVAFRSKEEILRADEAQLIGDVCFDIDMAQRKLEKIRARTESLQEYAVSEIQMLQEADTKLSAAIVAALLSGLK
jgi:hypothetical protein